MVQQRLFVGLPNKTSRERLAYFSHQTIQYCDQWMQERDRECGHDFLLYNSHGDPYSVRCLAEDFKRVLCKTFRGKKINDTGLDRWSTHRLRHTMATRLVSGGADVATVMAAGGWVTFDSMAGYAQVDPAVSRRGFQEAMGRVHEQKQSVPRTTSITPADLLKMREVMAVNQGTLVVNKRGV
jgi:integrase/recombinase XerC